MLPALMLVAAATATPVSSPDPCAPSAGHAGYTIVLDSGGQFHDCRNGRATDTEPHSREQVSLQMPPVDPDQPFLYRLRGMSAPTAHPAHNSLLKAQVAIVQEVEGELHALANSSEPLDETLRRLEPLNIHGIPGDAKPGPNASTGAQSAEVLRAAAAQAKYLSVVTPAFLDAFHALGQSLPRLEQASRTIGRLCSYSVGHVMLGPLRDAVERICAGGKPSAETFGLLQSFGDERGAFVEIRENAQDATLDLQLASASAGEESATAQGATHALRTAVKAARRLVADATRLVPALAHLESDLTFVRAALSMPASPAGARIHLGRFPAGGLFGSPDIYQIRVQREPSPLYRLSDESSPAADSAPDAADVLIHRFQPEPPDYFALGLSLLYAGGLPPHPDLSGRLGSQKLVAVPTEGFVGGVQASLKPLQFTNLPDPWASLLHFPTLIVPFTESPLDNYFIGGGIGWNDVGSIDVGVHLALTREPAAGVAYGTEFNTSPIELDHVTQPGPLQAGYFIAFSLDVIGIVHLIVGRSSPSVRDVGSGGDATSALQDGADVHSKASDAAGAGRTSG